MVVVYKWGKIAFDDYSLAKVLILPSAAKDDVPITFHDAGEDYQVPVGKVFIVGKVSFNMGSLIPVSRFGESDVADGAITKEVVKLGVLLLDRWYYDDVLGIYTAGKYVTAETTSVDIGADVIADTTLYGVEIPA